MLGVRFFRVLLTTWRLGSSWQLRFPQHQSVYDELYYPCSLRMQRINYFVLITLYRVDPRMAKLLWELFRGFGKTGPFGYFS